MFQLFSRGYLRTPFPDSAQRDSDIVSPEIPAFTMADQTDSLEIRDYPLRMTWRGAITLAITVTES